MTTNNSSNTTNYVVIGIIVAVVAITIIACMCAVLIAGASVFLIAGSQSQSYESPESPTFEAPVSNPTATPVVIRPTPRPQGDTPVPSGTQQPEATQQGSIPAAPGAAEETLKTLEEEIVPINDPIDLAERLEGKSNLPVALDGTPQIYAKGDQQTFWVTNSDTNENFEVDAKLGYSTDHVYFWIEDGVSYTERDLKNLVDTFEDEIYATNREFFGSEWTPGVDNDPHLYILYAHGLGGSVAGYFSSADEYVPTVRDYSNAHEMFLLSADHVDLDEEFAYGVLAHEFQHMIHWYTDRNEETWMNEGFSDVAMFLNGYDIGGADYVFVDDPDIQLTDWPTTPDNRTEHYGASFLFLTYFLDRFGEEATKALVADPANGMPSLDTVLAALGTTDPLTGLTITANDVFADWAIASYLQNESVGDGRYTYHNYPSAPGPNATETIYDCALDITTRDVSQYGADYIEFDIAACSSGEYTLNFEGSTQVNLLPADPYSGSYAFYSNKGDESNMTLTQEFDFSSHSGPLTLEYWTWYDLEEDYDYVHLNVSTDGENWQILTTPSGTAEDPSGNSYGWGYNGFSGGSPEWIQERVDLSQYAGQKVQIRFDYITDAAVNGDGMLIDDIAIPEINYFSDFEADDGGWTADGFVRVQNILPQTFRVSLITFGDETTVEYIQLSADNAAQIPLQIGSGVDRVVLVVSGTTPFTRQKAAYHFGLIAK